MLRLRADVERVAKYVATGVHHWRVRRFTKDGRSCRGRDVSGVISPAIACTVSVFTGRCSACTPVVRVSYVVLQQTGNDINIPSGHKETRTDPLGDR
jgi:hypothetical protein